ncbi:MAG: leucine-rich repeat domain-containing protein, partial [Candidatus Helarchaeota archaeon]
SIIPENIGNFKSLQYLNLKNNDFASLPLSFGNLQRLRSLYLSGTKLASLPESFGNLNTLETLHIWRNELSLLPKSFGNLKSLKILYLNKNRLSDLPPSFQNLQKLSKLYLNENQFKEFPTSLFKLNHLKILSLGFNEIQSLPDNFDRMETLEELILFNNKLTSIPESIGKIKSLRVLNLAGNQITIIPQSIGNLQNLEELAINRNQLVTLPGAIWPLRMLKKLRLEKNPYDNESNKYLSRDIPTILNYCRKKANITVFISHAWDDQEKYNILALKENLEQRAEIFNTLICEKDLVGNIQEFMDENIPKSQLIIFIGTKNALNSKACLHELALACLHGIEIIPIKGENISWNDLNQIDLRKENQGILDLGREKGIEYKPGRFDQFADELYEYIKQYKRKINLFETGKVKFERQKANMIASVINFMNSSQFEEMVRNNLAAIEELFKKLSENRISPLIYFKKVADMLSS